MLAYIGESDLIYKEQDVVIHGPWVRQLYADCGGHQCIFGNCPVRGNASSLILIKHAFIPWFVQHYTGLGEENLETNTAEGKLWKMSVLNSAAFTKFSFGSDTARPVDYAAPVWYQQVLNYDELNLVKSRFYR